MPYLDHEAGGWARVNTAHDAEPAGAGDGDGDGDDGLPAVVVWPLLDGDLGDVPDWKDSYLHRHLSRQPIGFCNTAEKRAATRKRSGKQGSCRLGVHITLAFTAILVLHRRSTPGSHADTTTGGDADVMLTKAKVGTVGTTTFGARC